LKCQNAKQSFEYESGDESFFWLHRIIF